MDNSTNNTTKSTSKTISKDTSSKSSSFSSDTINGEKITDNTITISDDMFIDNTYIIIKRGKKNYYIGRK